MGIKTKCTFGRTSRYVRDLSIVIAGIAVTFMVTGWISGRNEQKDLKRYMEMVKMELEDNLGIVQQQFDFYNRTGDFAKYLASAGNRENLQADSLAKYEDIMKNLSYMTYDASAFEMLKSSGTMRLIKDKKLLKSIINCYNLMERAKNIGDKTMDSKEKEFHNTIVKYGASDKFYDIRKPEYESLFRYFSVYNGREGNFRLCEQQIKKTLEMF